MGKGFSLTNAVSTKISNEKMSWQNIAFLALINIKLFYFLLQWT